MEDMYARLKAAAAGPALPSFGSAAIMGAGRGALAAKSPVMSRMTGGDPPTGRQALGGPPFEDLLDQGLLNTIEPTAEKTS